MSGRPADRDAHEPLLDWPCCVEASAKPDIYVQARADRVDRGELADGHETLACSSVCVGVERCLDHEEESLLGLDRHCGWDVIEVAALAHVAGHTRVAGICVNAS